MKAITRRAWSLPSLAALVFITSCCGGRAAAPPGYPKISPAVGRHVVSDLPRKPADLKRRFMTGVTDTAQDRVWLLNAIAPQSQVYAAER